MRLLAAFVVALLPLLAAAQKDGDRYGVARDTKKFPQATPKEAFASVVKAVEGKQFDYLTAHLADPAFVDERIKGVYGGRFQEQVEDIRAALGPAALKQLRRFHSAGKWAEEKDDAVVRLDDDPQRVVRLVRRGGRWYLSNDWGRR